MSALRPRPFRNPGIAAMAVLVMAMGIGAFSASVVISRGLLLDLPVEEPDRVVQVARTLPRWPGRHFSLPASWLREIEDGVSGLEVLGGFVRLPAHLTGEGGPPVRARAARVTPGVLQALGVQPFLGRWIQPGDELAEEDAVLLGHGLWVRRFGEDRGVLGRRIEVNDRPGRIVGVMPPGFAFPTEEELWAPLESAASRGEGSVTFVTAVGRLREDASVESVRAELGGFARGQQEAGIQMPAGAGLTARTWVEMLRDGDGTAEAVPALVTLFVLVLLVACANVALLFLVRALRAERSTAMRMALGAPRSTVIAERLLETLTLAALGGLLGLAVMLAWTEVMRRLGAGHFAYGTDFAVDWAVTLATAAGILTAALVAGLLPALRGTDLDLAHTLRQGAGGSVRLGRGPKLLVVIEIAFSCAVLVAVGHSVRGIRGTLSTAFDELPMPAGEVLVARYELLEARHPDPGARSELHRRVVEGLLANPGVEEVAVADVLPGATPGYGARIRLLQIEGTEHMGEENLAGTNVLTASPAFFSFLDVDVVQGRALGWGDGSEGERVAVVNESFVRRYLAEKDPLGVRIALAPNEWRTIVGVVRDVATERPDGTAHAVYLPVSETRGPLWVLVWGGGEPLALAPMVRSAIWDEDPRIPVYDVDTLAGIQYDSGGPAFLLIGTMAAFGLAALLITLVGLHGLIAFTLRRRVREIAIRSALGARARTVAWQLLRGVGGRVLLGVAAGTALAWWFSPYLGEGLLGADPRDPGLYVLVPLVLSLAALAAALTPLIRSLRGEVMEALRVE